MKKVRILISVCILILIAVFVTACQDSPNNQSYGEVEIADIKVYINSKKSFTFAQIEPTFTKPEQAELLTYEYDTKEISIENNIVVPLKRADKTLDVTASSQHFTTTFKVEVEYINLGGDNVGMSQLYDTTSFETAITARAQRCMLINKDTTLFIGDSFMDDYFVGEYMKEFSKGKEVLNAGISSTTSYHWEAIYANIIGSIAPKNIILHIGTNNFYDAHDGVEFTQDSLTRLMMFLHTKYPASNIYWFNITQRVDTAFKNQVSETNDYMAKWCDKFDWIKCVDTSSKITNQMLKDGVHLQTQSYKVLTNALVEAGCEIVLKA